MTTLFGIPATTLLGLAGLYSPLDLKADHAAKAGHLPQRERVLGMGGQTRIGDA